MHGPIWQLKANYMSLMSIWNFTTVTEKLKQAHLGSGYCIEYHNSLCNHITSHGLKHHLYTSGPDLTFWASNTHIPLTTDYLHSNVSKKSKAQHSWNWSHDPRTKENTFFLQLCKWYHHPHSCHRDSPLTFLSSLTSKPIPINYTSKYMKQISLLMSISTSVRVSNLY